MSIGYTSAAVYSDPAAYANGCRGKVPYRSKKQANGAVRVMARDTGATTLNAYSCRCCRHWHIGNSRRRAA